MFLKLLSIKWSNFIVWLSLVLELMGSMCIVITYYPVCDVKNFVINLSFLIKPFFYMSKNSVQQFIYFKNENSLR